MCFTLGLSIVAMTPPWVSTHNTQVFYYLLLCPLQCTINTLPWLRLFRCETQIRCHYHCVLSAALLWCAIWKPLTLVVYECYASVSVISRSPHNLIILILKREQAKPYENFNLDNNFHWAGLAVAHQSAILSQTTWLSNRN